MIQSLSVNINNVEHIGTPQPNLVSVVSPLLSPQLGPVRSLSTIFDDKKALALAKAAEQEMISKSAFPEKYQFAGYLSIRNHTTTHHWSQMYCVLSNNFLFAADTKYSTKLSVCIALEGCNTKLTTQSSDMTFEIHRHCFRATSPQLCKEWIANIQKASNLTIYDVYRFGYELGSSKSSHSKVIAAKHKVSNQEHAIKILNKQKCNDKATLQREIQILKKLKSPYIVELCDLFETSKYLYIVMEICKGGELFDQIANMDYINGARYTEQDVHGIMHQLASGVQYMHEMGIVHRDLKPENILCVEPNSIEKIKIADFGISAIVDPNRMKPSRSRASTRHHKKKSSMLLSVGGKDAMMRTRVGTLSYTAPEILKYKPYDERVDYWSLGVIMYILVCGYPPFDADNDYLLSDEIIHEEVAFDAEDWSHVGEGTQDLIRRLLHKNPRRRANCQDIIEHSWKIDVKTAGFQKAHTKLKQTVFKRKLHTRSNTIEYRNDASMSVNALKDRMYDLQQLGISSLDDSVLKQKRYSHNNEIVNIHTLQFDAEHKENQIDAWQVGTAHTRHEPQQSKTLECLDLLHINPIENIMIANDEHMMYYTPSSPTFDIISYSNRSSMSANGDLLDLLYPSTATHSKQNSGQSVSYSATCRLSLISAHNFMDGSINQRRRSISKQQQRHKRRSLVDKKKKKTSYKRCKANRVKEDKNADNALRPKIQISDYDVTDHHLNITNYKHCKFSSL